MNEFELASALETERLLLRPFVAGDFDALLAMRSRPDVARYLYWEPQTEAEVRVTLEKKIASRAIREEGDVIALAGVLEATDELVADFVLWLVSKEHQRAEIGFVVHPNHHGHGFGTEGARELLRLAFEDIGLHRVVGSLEARNSASARVLEKLGMRREAHFVENEFVKGEWQSEVVYAILAREWRDADRAGSQGLTLPTDEPGSPVS